MMKRRNRPVITEGSQLLTFTRRAMVVGGFQGLLGAALAGRMAYISIAENERYKLLSESNRVQLRLIPPRRGWIVDRAGQPIAINRSDFRVDLIPDRLKDPDRIIAELTRLLELPPDEVERIREELKHAAGYQPVPVAENLPFEKYAAVTIRQPELPGVAPLRAFSRFYPDGAAVAHLVGYVGTPNKEEYEKEGKAPLLITPGFKIGKEGVEKTMELRLRGRPGAQRVEVTAGGKLVRQLTTFPDKSGGALPLTIDAGLQTFAARRLGEESGSVVVLDCLTGDILACLDARLRSQQLHRRDQPQRVEDAVGRRAQALAQQGAERPLPARLDLQADGRHGPAPGRDRPQGPVNCPGGFQLGNRFFRCLGRHGSMTMHTPSRELQHLFLRHGPARRDRHHLGDGQAPRLRPEVRHPRRLPELRDDAERPWKKARYERAPSSSSGRTGPSPTPSTPRSARASSSSIRSSWR